MGKLLVFAWPVLNRPPSTAPAWLFQKTHVLSEEGEALSFAGRSEWAASGQDVTMPGLADQSRMANWYAAYTAPRHEKSAARQLQLSQLECFLPLYSTVRRWKNRTRVRLDLPLFPSYVFVRMTRREYARALAVPGIINLVGSGRSPSPLPDSDIESLRHGLPDGKVAPHPFLVAGEKARITCGPFAGMTGILVRQKNQFRVVLTLELIKQSVAVEIDSDEIEPVRF